MLNKPLHGTTVTDVSKERSADILRDKFLDCLSLKMKALHSSETSVIIYQWTKHNTPEDVKSCSVP
jgi:hypothetical protein